jgi:hypothetical protein
LRAHFPYGKDRRAIPFQGRARCRSSVVEHSLGKGEVVSSILTGSTRIVLQNECLRRGALPCLPRFALEQVVIFPRKLGENQGTLFYGCSAPFHCSASRWSPFSRCLGVKRDLGRIIESIVSAITSPQSSNQTARPKADALNQRPANRLTCCAARVAASRNAVLNNKRRRTDSAAESSPAVSGDACEILVRTRLSSELERDAFDGAYVEPWQHENEKRRPDGSRGCGKGCEGQSPSRGHQ